MPFYSDPLLSSDTVTHAFFGCGADRTRVMQELNLSHLHTVHQIHSAQCVYAPHDAGADVKGDAMVTDQAGQALGIITADCAPVLLAGKNSKGHPVIGAAHAGWRGALHGVVENTLAMMADLGAAAEAVAVAIGPCIAPASYEVSADFLAPFLTQDAGNAEFFSAGKNDGVRQFDLPGYLLHRLRRAGVRQAAWCGIDTYAREAEYFSYRRATHRAEPDYGRQLSVIAIKGR